METDQDPQDTGTPPGTPFDAGVTPTTTRGHNTDDPTGSLRTENYFTPLYTKPQDTEYSAKY